MTECCGKCERECAKCPEPECDCPEDECGKCATKPCKPCKPPPEAEVHCPEPDSLVFFMLGVIFMSTGGGVAILLCTTMDLVQLGWFLAGLSVLCSVGISAYDIHEHFMHWQQPILQRYCVRILLMVPIYGLQSWFALVFQEKAFFLETLREMYEAWVIYSFVYLLIAYLGGSDPHTQEANVIEILKTKPAERGHHAGGIQYCFKHWVMGKEFLVKSKIGAQQYVVLRGVCTAVALGTYVAGVYGEGGMDPATGYFWVTLVVNFSQLWALYVLAFFYYALREDLAPLKPVGKFLCVKSVVFFAWWQSVAIQSALQMHIVQPGSGWTPEEFASFANDWILCCEMFIAAVGMHYSYSYRDFYRYDKPAAKSAGVGTYLAALHDSANPRDVVMEIDAAGKAVTAAVGPPRGEVVFSVYKEVMNGKLLLKITIKEAHALREASLGGTSEPYCIVSLIGDDGQPMVKLAGHTKTTKTVTGTINPVWNEQVLFGGNECELTEAVWGVLISIRSKQVLRHARLGDVTASIRQLEPGTPITVSCALDILPPKVVTREPAHKAGNVAIPVDQLVMNFNEEVKAGVGFVRVLAASAPDIPIASANVRNTDIVMIYDHRVIVKLPPGAISDPGAIYFVTVDAGAFMDDAENHFEGFNDASDWTFRTHKDMSAKLKDMGTTLLKPVVQVVDARLRPNRNNSASNLASPGGGSSSSAAAAAAGEEHPL